MIGESLGATKKSYRGRYRWPEATQKIVCMVAGSEQRAGMRSMRTRKQAEL